MKKEETNNTVISIHNAVCIVFLTITLQLFLFQQFFYSYFYLFWSHNKAFEYLKDSCKFYQLCGSFHTHTIYYINYHKEKFFFKCHKPP